MVHSSKQKDSESIPLDNRTIKAETGNPARIVLINPSMNLQAGFGDFARIMEPMPCIGIAYLSACLKQAGHKVLSIDNFALNKSPEELFQIIDNFGAEFVGQSCLTPTAQVAFEFNRFLQEKRPAIKTILGNVHASIFAEEIIQKEQADFILEGESEISLPMLLDKIKQGAPLDDVPGLHYRNDQDGSHLHTGPPLTVEDLDSIPFPDWSDLPWKKYTFLPFVTMALPALAIMGSRGCPYHCTFCALGYQGRYRLRKPEQIVDEMSVLAFDYGIKHIGFVDPIFPVKKDHLLSLCDLIRQRIFPEDVTWTCETRVDCIDREMMEAMKSAGLKRLLFGIESGEDRLLKAVNKNFTTAKVRECIRLTREVGIETSCFFILGLPGETIEETKKTISFPVELDVDFAKFAILIPLPGSRLFNDLVKSGKLATEDWRKFTTFNPSAEDLPFVPEGMTGNQLIRYQKAANLKFYFRPRIIFRHLFKIRTVRLRHLAYGFLIWARWKFSGWFGK